MQQYPYFLGNLFLFILWFTIFLARKDLRKEMLMMGMLFAILGPISEYWYYKDYWKPALLINFPIAIEDILFGFNAGGIGSVLYEILLNKKLVKIKEERRSHKWFLLVSIIVAAALLHFFVDFNSIYDSVAIFWIATLVVILLRRKLVINALFSGLFFSLFYGLGLLIFIPLFPGVVERYWLLYGTLPIIWGVPITELFWAFSFGAMCGPLYEFWQGYRLRRQ